MERNFTYLGTIKRPPKRRSYTYEQYEIMAKYIIANNSKIKNLDKELCTIKNNDVVKVSLYKCGDRNVEEYDRCTANGVKALISRLFRETAKECDDAEYYEMITGRSIDYYDDNFYISCKTEKITEKEEDFFSMDVIFLLPKFQGDMKGEIKSNIKELKQTALDKCYERLQRSKKYKDVQKEFIEPKRVIWRKNFGELIITIGLRQEILDLKEEITKEAKL